MNEVWAVYAIYYDDNGNEIHDIIEYRYNENSAITQAENLYNDNPDYYRFGTDVKRIEVKD